MAGQNSINAIRQAFQIPDSVVIIAGSSLLPPRPAAPAKPPNFDIDQTATADKELYRSTLGTPVVIDIEFPAGQYETNTPGVFKNYGPMTLDAVLVVINQPKKIIKTEIQGRDGTVKEYIGMGDYSITINGILSGPNGSWPVDDITALKAILDAPQAIDVAGKYFTNLDIHSIVVEEYTFEQKEGGYSYQTFSITASSDIPQELRLTNV